MNGKNIHSVHPELVEGWSGCLWFDGLTTNGKSAAHLASLSTAWLGLRLLPHDYVSLRIADHIEQLLLLGRRNLEFIQGFLELLGHHVPLFFADV